jgi:hypothetical protein
LVADSHAGEPAVAEAIGANTHAIGTLGIAAAACPVRADCVSFVAIPHLPIQTASPVPIWQLAEDLAAVTGKDDGGRAHRK